MKFEFPISFAEEFERSEIVFDRSLDRLAKNTEFVIIDNKPFSEVNLQGINENILDVFKAALLIVHEFICTESERFLRARESFSATVNVGIAACVTALSSMYPNVQGYEAHISYAFKIAYDVGVKAFCNYVKSEISS